MSIASNSNVLSMDEHSSCIVCIDGDRLKSKEFVAALFDEESKELKLYFDADALTVGMAVQMLQRLFIQMMDDLSPEDCAAVTAILCGEEFTNEQDRS